jgi:ADP-dependent NAD(P)H-hydrate dehydratase / NAD(P)H-hydrate epimerase
MIKVLTAEQIKRLDQYTIEHEPISSIELMERACRVFVDWFVNHYPQNCKIGIVCGTGNNGGDGLGIARMLFENRFNVHVWIVRGESKETEEFKLNYKRAREKISLDEISISSKVPVFDGFDILIDAIFGYGLSRPPAGVYATVIKNLNQTSTFKIAVDIPSGLMADGPCEGEIVKAHRTLSFQTPKLAFLLPQSHPYVGEWTLLDIGLSKQMLTEIQSKNLLVQETDVRDILRKRNRFDHKGTFGHALLIAGSLGKMGASVLGAKAALRSGVGLLTAHVPKCGNDILQLSVPEAMTSIDLNANYFSSGLSVLSYDAIGIGSGLGKNPDTVKALENILGMYKKPMVIDADALNILSENDQLIPLIHAGSIFTPHPKEFERLVGSWANDFQRLDKQREYSSRTNCVIIVKGAFTSIALPNGTVYFNPTGNPGMATGGSGDILTGILAGLMAQGYSSAETAILGVYLHGLAGDLAVQELGIDSLIASDLITFLPKAFKKLQKET